MIPPSRDAFIHFVLIALIVITFLMGGGARDDLISLVVLRPLSLLALALAVAVTPRATWDANRGLILAALALPAVILLHLVPLPPALWHALPGRELAVRIDAAVGLADHWRPLSLAPYRTLNALLATALPLAGLLLALALPRERLVGTVYLMLGIALVSATLGLFQILGGTGNPFYLYRITNEGSAVGLFANRNHNAMLLALIFPLIAATARLVPAAIEGARPREWFAAGSAVLVIPFLLATQSRAGIIIGLFGLASAAWVYGRGQGDLQSRRQKVNFDPRLLFVAFAVVTMVILTMLTMKTNAIQRLTSIGRYDDELRLRVWGPIARLAGEYLPFGSGIGTFVEAYAVTESDALLRPTYLNHAHNDWLEIVMTGGLPLLLVVLAGGFVVIRGGLGSIALEPRARLAPLRRLGLAVTGILGVASIYDYPLRVPSLALFFALAVVWLAGRKPAPGPVVAVPARDVGTATAT